VKRVKKHEPIADSLTCWNIGNWPQHVFPHDPDAGRHIVRSHREELANAGALVRVNRELVVIGLPYLAWLKTRRKGVKDIEMPCNAPEHAAKRGGRAEART